jgi:hypothetical protein
VRRMLRNSYYIGKGTTRKRVTKRVGGKLQIVGYRSVEEQVQIAEGIIPPIIEEEIFIRAQELMGSNKKLATRSNANPEASLLRGGYAICGRCGEVLRAISMSPDPDHGMKHPRYLYQCYDQMSRKRCNKVNITCHILDDAAWEYAKTLIADEHKVETRLQEIEAMLTESTVDLTPIDSQIAVLVQDMQNCAKGIVKAKDDYTIELLTIESEKLAAAKKELEALRDEMKRKANNIELIRSKIDCFREKWFGKNPKSTESSTYQDKREACEMLGIQAIVNPHGQQSRYHFRIIPPEIVTPIS